MTSIVAEQIRISIRFCNPPTARSNGGSSAQPPAAHCARDAPGSCRRHRADGVSFTIGAGERVALVGHSEVGQDHSSALHSGRLHTGEWQSASSGTISSLFEISIGFDLEATGRETSTCAAL